MNPIIIILPLIIHYSTNDDDNTMAADPEAPTRDGFFVALIFAVIGVVLYLTAWIGFSHRFYYEVARSRLPAAKPTFARKAGCLAVAVLCALVWPVSLVVIKFVHRARKENDTEAGGSSTRGCRSSDESFGL